MVQLTQTDLLLLEIIVNARFFATTLPKLLDRVDEIEGRLEFDKVSYGLERLRVEGYIAVAATNPLKLHATERGKELRKSAAKPGMWPTDIVDAMSEVLGLRWFLDGGVGDVSQGRLAGLSKEEFEDVRGGLDQFWDRAMRYVIYPATLVLRFLLGRRNR